MLSEPALKARFEEWDRPARTTQIAAITSLTALLYVIFALMDKSWAPEEIQNQLRNLQLFVLVPLLLSLSILAYSGKYYPFLLKALTVFPLISMPAHAYMASLIPDEGRFLTEGYLGVIWTFVVCGLPFRYGFVSATLFGALLAVSGYFFIDESSAFVLHLFWLFCSYSFGFLGGLILDRTRKSVFLYQEELQNMAVTDALTGVFNRNKFNQVLGDEILRAKRYEHSFGLALIDIDHFKSINDNYGHDVGDKILQQIAQTLKANIRENDTLVRWGGEEFAVIALEINPSKFKALCEKLRASIEAISFDQTGPITTSIGAAHYHTDETPNSLLKRADTALYKAKNQGRNCVVLVDEIE